MGYSFQFARRLPPARFPFLLLIILVWGFSTRLNGQEEGYYRIQTGERLDAAEARALLPADFELFGSDEPLEVKIYSDFRNLVRRKFKDEWQPAFLHLESNDIRIVRKIRIRPRGNSRKEICYLPPITLDFSKSDIQMESLQDLEKMKLVSYCKRGAAFQDLILKEYLTYQLYNRLTPLSFRCRLIRMTYVDTGGKKENAYEGFSFLIEEVDRLANRNEAIQIKTEGVNTNQTDLQYADLVAVFQFMIGNLDWSIPALHNIKLVKSKDPTRPLPIPVPYDFDYSGLVNAPYAIPPEVFNLKDVRQRKFWGFCRTATELEPTLQLFREQKTALLGVISDFPYLSKGSKKDALDFLEGFFRIINDAKQVRTNILDDCRTQ